MVENRSIHVSVSTRDFTYPKFLLRVDGTHYAQATLFVWEESYDLKEERTWPLVSIALFDEDGKPVKLQSVESKKESESVER